MREKSDRRSRFRLIQGGLRCQMSFGPIRIVAAPENSPPFAVEALVVEEDTWLIMSAEPKIGRPEEHPVRLMTDLLKARPKSVGSVLVKGRNPIHFMAIVHDVNQDPTWREEWIESALREIFRQAERRRIRAIGLPLLGTIHGKLANRRFGMLLARALVQTPLKHLRCLWLMAPTPVNTEIIELLQSMLIDT